MIDRIAENFRLSLLAVLGIACANAPSHRKMIKDEIDRAQVSRDKMDRVNLSAKAGELDRLQVSGRFLLKRNTSSPTSQFQDGESGLRT